MMLFRRLVVALVLSTLWVPALFAQTATLVDTVYVVDSQTLSSEQRRALSDSLRQVLRRKDKGARSRLEIGEKQKASLDELDGSYRVEEVGLKYSKGTEESVSADSDEEDQTIPESGNAVMDVNVTGGPGDAMASRVKYTWNIDHDDVRDVEARLGTYAASEGGGWNDGFDSVPKTDDNFYGSTYDEYSEGTRESTVGQNDQPVNQEWAFTVNDTDRFDGNKGHIDWVELTVYYQVQQETTLDLSLSDSSPAWGKEVTLTAELCVPGTFYGCDSNVDGRDVTFQLGGTQRTRTTQNGTATVTIEAPTSVGSYTASASFGGDDAYEASSDNASLTTGKHATRVVEFSDVEAREGSDVELTARLVDDGPVGRYEGDGVGGETIVFYQAPDETSCNLGWSGCEEIGRAQTNGSGYATVTYDNVDRTGPKSRKADSDGDSIYARFTGSSKYEASYGTATLTIRFPTETEMEIASVSPSEPGWGGDVEVTAELYEAGLTGNYISGRDVDISVAGEAKTVQTNSDGQATVRIGAPESVGSYDVSASFGGDSDYKASSANRSGAVETQKHATRIDVKDATAQEGGSVELSATLVDDGPVSSDQGNGVDGQTLVFYQKTADVSDCSLSGVNCDKIGEATTDEEGVATLQYDNVSPTGSKRAKDGDTDNIWVQFKGSALYTESSGEGEITIEYAAPALSKAQDPFTKNEDGTVVVRVEADPNGGTLKEVSAHYQPTGCLAVGNEATVSLSREGNGVWKGILPDGADSYEPCYLEEFTDGTEVKYRFTATNENDKTAKYPTDRTYKTVEARNGDVPKRLAVTGSGKNLVDVQVEKISENGDRVTSKVTLTNQTFLYWGAEIRKNGDPIQDPEATSSSNWGTVASGITTVAGLDEASDAYVAGNRYDLTAFGTDRKEMSFEVTSKPDDKISLTLERTHWTTDVLSLLQITRNVTDVLKRRIAKEKSIEDPGLRKLASMPPRKRAKLINSVVDAFGEALLERVADDLESEASTLANYPDLYDALTGKDEMPGRLALLKKLGSYSIGLLQDGAFYEEVLDEITDRGTGDDRVDTVLNSIKSLLGSFSATVKATQGIVTGASLGQNIYEALTLPKRSYLSLEHRSLLAVKSSVHGPRRVEPSQYPAGPNGHLRDSLSNWLTVSPDEQNEQIRIRVHNPTDAQALDNVWVGADLWTSSGGEENAPTPGRKIESTLTPIADPATGKKGNLDFQAYQCQTNACEQTTRLDGDATTGDFGQGVRLKTGETIELRADYSFSESVTGHTFHPGTYFLRYRVWYNGYPGSSTGEAVTALRTRRLRVIDDERPRAPLASKYPSRPFRLSAVQNSTGTVLTWIRNDSDEEPDVSFYRIERAPASEESFSTVQWVSARKSRFVDRQATSDGNYRYRITALDNAGRTSDKSGVTNTVPPRAPTQLTVEAGNKQVDLSWTASTSDGVAGYRVYRDSVSFQKASEAVRVSDGLIADGTSFTDAGLTNGRTYHYSVAAVDRTGDESALPEARSATPVTEEDAPVIANEIEDQTLTKEDGVFEKDLTTVFANPIASVSDLSYTAASDDDRVATASVEGTTLSVTPEGETGTATVTVVASNPAGETPTVFDVTVDEVPEAPVVQNPISDQTLQVTGAFTKELRTVFSDPNGEALTYETDVAEGTKVVSATIDGDQGVLAVDPLSAGEGVIEVTATDETGKSATESFGVTVENPAPTLTALSPSEAPADTSVDVTLGGSGFVSSASAVEVSGSGVSVQQQTVESSSEISVTFAVASGASLGGREVTVVNPAPGGGTSAARSFSVVEQADTTPPAAPTSLTATGGYGQVDLSWDSAEGTDPAGYNIYRATTAFEDTTNAARVNGALVTETTYVDDGRGELEAPQGNTTYYYRVTAVDAAGNESAPSNEDTAQPRSVDDAPPATPSTLTATASTGAIDLSWPAGRADDLQRYHVYRDTTTLSPTGGPQERTPYDSIAAGTSTYTDSQVSMGVSYHYRVTAVDTAGNESRFSEEAVATPEPDYVVGDPSGDSTVTAADASLVLQHAVDLTEFDRTQRMAADVSGDSTANAADASLILQYVVDLIDQFPVEESNSTSGVIAGKAASAGLSRTGATMLEWGELSPSKREGVVRLPLQLSGSSADVQSATLTLEFDPRATRIEDVRPQLSSGWQANHNVNREEGTLQVAMAGAKSAGEGELVILYLDVKSKPGASAARPSLTGTVSLNGGQSRRLARKQIRSIPSSLTLKDNYPNPVRRETTIEYGLPEETKVQVELFDVLGRRVETLVQEKQRAGQHTATVQAEGLSSGTYFYRIKAAGSVKTGRMTIVR